MSKEELLTDTDTVSAVPGVVTGCCSFISVLTKLKMMLLN